MGIFTRSNVILPADKCGADCPSCHEKEACTRSNHSRMQDHRCKSCGHTWN